VSPVVPEAIEAIAATESEKGVNTSGRKKRGGSGGQEGLEEEHSALCRTIMVLKLTLYSSATNVMS